MAYDKFNILTSTQQFHFSIENVDTDQIIPARFFLKQQSVLVLVTTFSATGDTTMTTHLSQISF
jgi:3-isopropylmalate dehydratase small subunit